MAETSLNAARDKTSASRSSPRQTRLRVAVASSLPFPAAGLQALLRHHADIEVVSTRNPRSEGFSGPLDADVLIVDLDETGSSQELASLAGFVPIVGVTSTDSPVRIRTALSNGIRAVLPHGFTSEELAVAIRAAGAGLAAISVEFLEILLHPEPSDESEAMLETLTVREHDVLGMMAEGLPNKEIAGRLKISEHTVKFHVSSIMGKMGAASRTEAVTRGIRRGLVVL